MPPSRIVRAGPLLLIVSVLLPVLLFALAAWENREDVARQVDDRVGRTLRLLHEHAVKVLETQNLILERINGRLRGLDWSSESERADLDRMLRDLENEYDQLATIVITDAEGRLVATSRDNPVRARTSFADRDWFRALLAEDLRVPYVSRSYLGRQSQQPIFNLARRVASPDGRFRGAIALSLDRAYFEKFYQGVDADTEHSVTLVRSDGHILARFPSTGATTLPPDSQLAAAIQRGDSGTYTGRSGIDGVERRLGYSRIGTYPVFINFGVSEQAIAAQWWRNVEQYGVVAGLSMLALLGASALAIREARQEQVALRRWRTTADALALEADRRLRVEAQLRQAQKMEAVGRLTGGIAHDFNNLLTVVIGNIELTRRRLVAPAEDRVARGLDNALEGARRAATLTQRLLAFSRQSPLAPEAIDANRLVGGMADLFARTLGEPIVITTALGPDLWWIEADVNQLESALLNLAVNARDAMPDGGRLVVETTNVVLDEEFVDGNGALQAGEYVLLAVSDDGLGMTPEVMGQVFEPFFTTKAVGAGTGLGLAQVYGFMRQSGGHASIYSEPGLGTTVKLYFPRLNQAARSAEAAPAGAFEIPTLFPASIDRASRAGMTVLALEDDPLVRSFSVSALEEAGYRVLPAAEGPEALAILDAHPEIDLLFTDVVLTGPMDGRAVADEALRRRPNLKVLFTTGYTRAAIVHHGRLDEGVNFLGKPFTAASLGRKVRALLPA